jgi:hypothetical protein
MSTRVVLHPRSNRRRPPPRRDADLQVDITDAKRSTGRESVTAAERFPDLLAEQREG